jgi:rhamnopyranosyl-N-acetylglucosaminyl-diphospho-decaprenol beta-1,3/1,4-galactofuranosyltransferase
MSDYRVCAVVVTFNRKDLLIECLESLKNQSYPLDGIYVVDNASTDGTNELLFENGYIEKLTEDNSTEMDKGYSFSDSVNEKIKFHYVRLSENTGGAGGFYEGVKRAYEEGYDWLWLMDDDAEPVNDALEKLSEYFDEENVSALAGVVKTPDDNTVPFHRGFFDFNSFWNYKIAKSVQSELIDDNKVLEIDVISFVGVLIDGKSITEIGFPKKEFFIYGDDYEYSIRLRSVGRILLVTDSVILHKDFKTSDQATKEIFGNPYYKIKYEKYWTRYYEIRNNMWLLKRYRRTMLSFWMLMIVSWLFNVVMIILFDDRKFKRIYLTTSAYSNAFNDNFDNERPKEILYKG